MNLNPQQMAAVEYNQGPMLIIAGAGSGKTKTVVSKILHCIEHQIAEPHQIMATTFTNKATNELRHRLRAVAEDKVNYMTIGTFHSISLEILQKHGSYIGVSGSISVLPYEDQVQVVRGIITSKKLKDLSPGRILEKLQKYKEQASSEQKMNLNSIEEDILAQYSNELTESKVMDFADLLISVRNMLRDNKEAREIYRNMFKLICVDEYQDVNNIQQEMIKLLYGPDTHLCCVGDPDQAIYGFRGANCSYILNFAKVFEGARIFRLEQNYRSSQNILKNANSLISYNKKRIPKNLFTEINEIKEKVRVTSNMSPRIEADRIASSILHMLSWKKSDKAKQVGDQKPEIVADSLYSEEDELQEVGSEISLPVVDEPSDTFAILVRNRSQIQPIEEALIRYNIAYSITGSVKFLDRAEIRDLISYLKFLNNPLDTISFKRMVQAPRRGIGDVTIEKIIAHSRDHRIDLLEACEAVATAKTATLMDLSRLLRVARELENKGVKAVAKHILHESKYNATLNTERMENVNQWLISLENFNSIKEYLDEIIWKSEANEERKVVNLMTIHASKGLEFDYVYLPGWEEGTLPSGFGSDEVEEERRLAYVALTRARKLALISHSSVRFVNGMSRPANPSRFLRELKDVQIEDRSAIAYRRY